MINRGRIRGKRGRFPQALRCALGRAYPVRGRYTTGRVGGYVMFSGRLGRAEIVSEHRTQTFIRVTREICGLFTPPHSEYLEPVRVGNFGETLARIVT